MSEATPKTANEYRDEMIARYEADIKKYEGFLSVHMLTSRNHVLRVGGIYIVPTIENGRIEAHSKCGWECDPLKAPQFTKEDAISVAKGLQNGNGDKGEAIGINQAVREELAKAKDQIEFLNGIGK